jgi:hypothetical protein
MNSSIRDPLAGEQFIEPLTLAEVDLYRATARMSARNARILAMRCGLDGRAPLTFIEIGRELGISAPGAREGFRYALYAIRSRRRDVQDDTFAVHAGPSAWELVCASAPAGST